ncbi:MAG: hypothetical protein AB7K24_20690 [Gemmataceae bacterium]
MSADTRQLDWETVLERIETALVEAEASVSAHEKQLKQLDALAVPAWNAWRERLEQWTDQLSTLQELSDRAVASTRATDEALENNEAALRDWLQQATRTCAETIACGKASRRETL